MALAIKVAQKYDQKMALTVKVAKEYDQKTSKKGDYNKFEACNKRSSNNYEIDVLIVFLIRHS